MMSQKESSPSLKQLIPWARRKTRELIVLVNCEHTIENCTGRLLLLTFQSTFLRRRPAIAEAFYLGPVLQVLYINIEFELH